MQIEGPKGLVEGAKFFAKELGIDGYDFTLTIRREFLDNDTLGLCSYCPENDEYEISLERRSHDFSMYEMLAHELIHVRQYVLGHLRDEYSEDMKNVSTYWKGELWEDESYLSSPWEVEAYNQQNDLYVKYLALKYL